MKNLLVLILMLFCTFCSAQTKEQLMDSIIKENVFHSEYVGGAGSKSRVYTWYEQLMELVTDDELKALAKHKMQPLECMPFRD